MTACYCAWIVACHARLPILPLFNLHFCKICLHFSYTPFSLSFALFLFVKIQPCHFYLVIRAMRDKSLILNGFFLPKRLPKLAINATKMASPWILKGFFIVKCVMSLFYNALLQIVITSYCLLLYKTMLRCYDATQRYYVKLFNTYKTLKLKTVKKQSFINYFKIFYDFLEKSLDLMRLLLHNTPNNSNKRYFKKF